jgi:hypothetical protein
MPRQGIPQSILNLGILTSPLDTKEMAEKISETRSIGFEEYRLIIKLLIPNIEDQLVQSIQQFRNSIHPYKAMKEPDVFAKPDIARAMMYIPSLELIVKKIASWNP